MTGSERVLARVVFPTDGDLDVLPLYVDGQQVPVATEGGAAVVPVTYDQNPDQVLGRRSYSLGHGQRASFATYFNAFPAGYWRRWSVLAGVRLRVRTSGDGTLMVYRSSARGAVARVTSRSLSGSADEWVTLPLNAFGDGGWYWFDLVAGRGDLVLEQADWVSGDLRPEAEEPPHGSVTVGITTFNRPAYCTALLEQLGSAQELHGVVDEVLVVDQGTQPVRDDAGFDAASAALGSRLRVVEQGNLGGSGGFARAMLETLDVGRSDHVLLLDDDVVCEPEGVARAVTFADFARTPTVVGGHMFSMYERSVLHAFAERVAPWQFRWAPAAATQHDHDLSESNLRSTPWLHRRASADYNGWWMCLIPTTVLRDVGLSLPVFIKWDDAEFGLRAAAAGYSTVSLPGAAVWHVPWTDKDDSVDWQAYFHARNRFVAALLHTPFEHGGRMVRESLAIQLKHLMAMQYSAAHLRERALLDVLEGPDGLHSSLGTTLAEVRAARAAFDDARVATDPTSFAQVRPGKPRRRDPSTGKPVGQLATLVTAALGMARQLTPVSESSRRRPEREVPAVDAGWWTLSRLDSALVSTTDGTGVSWHRRDRAQVLAATRRATAVHQRLLREWPRLAAEYRAALPELVGVDAWRKTLDLPLPDHGDEP
ncbi:glycosyltransferase [Pedococcus sp. KACC 23699]|uniref:Glycosyltransferase n=1 Tax=Pedococcus sp. KACC 23699 TaxID=3149228 RepID=A0AAU7JTT1_9MICO